MIFIPLTIISSHAQSIENQLLWSIRKVSFPILLSILLFHAKHQNTNMEKKASGFNVTNLYAVVSQAMAIMIIGVLVPVDC